MFSKFAPLFSRVWCSELVRGARRDETPSLVSLKPRFMKIINNENVETETFNTMRPAHTIQKCRWSISNKDSRWVGFCLGEHGVSVSTEKWCWRTSVLKLWHFCIFSNLHLFQLVDRTATKVSINAFRSDLRIFVALIGTFETFKRKIHIFDTYGKLGI